MNNGDYKMKLFTIGTLFVLLALGGRASATPDCPTADPAPVCATADPAINKCPNTIYSADPAPVCATADPAPSGPSEVIACAAQQYSAKLVPPKSPPLDAATFWETVLFSTKLTDGFCKGAAPAVLQKAQLAMYTAACGSQKGTYFSYANFLAADAEISAKLGGAYTFMRQGTYEVRLQEFANFLATAAQETTAGDWGLKYTTDGLYFRYENGILQSTDPQWVTPPYTPPYMGSCRVVPANPGYTATTQSVAAADCRFKGLDAFIPEYYPISTYSVAVKGTVPADYLVNTSLVMDHADKYDTNTNTIANVGTPTLYAGGTYAAPAGYTWQYMNQIIDPGYWIGMGNLQLTGVSMVQFFGWYHQKISAGAPVEAANYQAFVTRYLTEGKLAWEGGLWYWNYRINGIGKPTLHSVLAGKNDACRDMGITTKLVNGGCNDGGPRDLYYNYFKTTVFGLSGTAVTAPGGVSSYTCSDAILAYCTK